MFVTVEEAFWSADPKAEGILKDLITSDKITVESKGVDAIEVDNCLWIMMLSNNDWIAPVARDGRRFAVLDVMPYQQRNRHYFGAIKRELESGGYEAFLDYLLAWDLSLCDLNNIPETDALNDQKLESMTP